MASKADMLRGGAKKASMGLFTGMQKLSEIETTKEGKKPEKAVEKVENKSAEKKTEEKKVENTTADTAQKKSEVIRTEEPHVIETLEIEKEQSQPVVEKSEQQIPAGKSIEVEAENRPEQSITDQPVNPQVTLSQNVDTQSINGQFSETEHKPIESIKSDQLLSKETEIQQNAAPNVNLVQQPVQPVNYQQTPLQQVPVQQPVQPQMQQIPQSPSSQLQNVVYSQPQVSNVPTQQPVYNYQQYAPTPADRTYESQYSQPGYSQPVMNYPQQQFSQPVHEPQARTVKAAKTEKQEKNSRYEKDKFLLLDIRGYRDYVEHMAKAANMSATKYIRNLIEQDMRVNHDIYEEQKRLEEMFKGRI